MFVDEIYHGVEKLCSAFLDGQISFNEMRDKLIVTLSSCNNVNELQLFSRAIDNTLTISGESD